MDRRLPGIILICLTLSTIVTYFAFIEGAEEAVTVIRNTAPETIRRQVHLELTHKFAFGLISRRRIERLVLKYSFFIKTDDLVPPVDTTTDGWASSLRDLLVQRRLMSDLGFEIESVRDQIEIDASKQEFLLFDGSEAFPAFTEWWLAEDTETSHLIIPEAEGNATHFLGKGSFYSHRGDLAKIVVMRGDEETIYTAQRSGQELQAGEKPISEAPRNGEIVFDDLEADEAVSVLVELMGRAGVERQAVSMVRIYVDGKLEDVVASSIG